MSKLNVDQKTVKELFENKKADFLIPDYQRPYAWQMNECQTLWEDIFAFAFPEDDYSKFDSDNDEYYLGPIVTFKNEDGKMPALKKEDIAKVVLMPGDPKRAEHIAKNYLEKAKLVKQLDKAKELIREENYTFTEISEKLGFNTSQYFTTVFKRVSGMTPSEYAKVAVRFS